MSELFDAERRVRQLHNQLRRSKPAPLMAALAAAIEDASALDPDAAGAQLVCIARLLGELGGADAVDRLIDVLALPHTEARTEAGEQLQGLAFDRFADLAAGVERAVERLADDSLALLELPYLLTDTEHEGALQLLSRLLGHRDADVVAAALEAMVELGDPAAIPALAQLEDDERTSVIGEDTDERFEARLSELAAEAVELLSAVGGGSGGAS